ncbi:AAA family ATPase [Peribacillus frigoritolerans]|uniref:AAA family ATPase n=1 Tax=Peribacillus frigoritolerans TaxID=450367 RepID=UPI002ED4D1A1|nr:AAA family ATPase [Peribacillus frigoritolerans]
MMKLKSIYINKLFNIERQEFTFYEPDVNYFDNLKVSVIVGENGTCKTSLLKFIAETFLYPNIKNKLKNTLQYGFTMKYQINNREIHLDHKNIHSLENSDYPKNVIVSTTALNGKFSTIQKRTNNTSYHYNGPLKSEMLSIVKVLRDPSLEGAVLELLNLVGYSKSYRIILPEIDILKNMIQKRKASNEIVNIEEFFKAYDAISDNHENKPRKKVIYASKINEYFLDCIQEFMERRINIDFRLEIRKPMNDEWIDIKDMSSGEQAIFNRFFSLLSIVTDNSIILIDEPETHLHPKWLKDYIYIITILFSKYKAHVIIATHSPFIAAEVPNECILGLVKDFPTGEVSQYEVTNSTLGGNPINILNDVFDLKSHTGSFTHSIINQIEANIRNGNTDKGIDMYNDLGTTVKKYSLFNKIKQIVPKEFDK